MIDKLGDQDGKLDRKELDLLVVALLEAGQIKTEDINGVKGFLQGLMSADEVTPADFGASLKNAV